MITKGLLAPQENKRNEPSSPLFVFDIIFNHIRISKALLLSHSKYLNKIVVAIICFRCDLQLDHDKQRFASFLLECCHKTMLRIFGFGCNIESYQAQRTFPSFSLKY
jgi:hypothetical protein